MKNNMLKKLGLKIGHYTNTKSLTGATVFIPDGGATIGIDVRGSNTGTINISAYEPKSASKTVEAVVFSGGSTFGLECAIGVMDYLKSPQVVGSVIYDGHVGIDDRPRLKDGYNMAETASYDNLNQGNIGVGTGATTGKLKGHNKLKGGFGISIKDFEENIIIGAFVVTNSVGDVINYQTNDFYSNSGKYNKFYKLNNETNNNSNTTLASIVTNVNLTREELMKISELAHDGMARAIFPVHTNKDGDVIFSMSTNGDNSIDIDCDRNELVNFIGINASLLLIEAINNSMENSESIDNFPTYNKFK